jgi:hypothetical protein
MHPFLLVTSEVTRFIRLHSLIAGNKRERLCRVGAHGRTGKSGMRYTQARSSVHITASGTQPRERRKYARFVCTGLIDVFGRTMPSSRSRLGPALVHNISERGARLQMDVRLPVGAALRLRNRYSDFAGTVRHCTAGISGYVIGIEFDRRVDWQQLEGWITFRELTPEVCTHEQSSATETVAQAQLTSAGQALLKRWWSVFFR